MFLPIVSVILPNYNHASYLKQRIESIINQSFQDFELILLDDCSTDCSTTILQQYSSHPKVSHVLFNKKNSGSTFLQWDKGLNLARGEYVWIAESDDYADPSFLAKMIAAFQADPKAVLAFSGSHMVDQNSQSIDMNWDHFGKNKEIIRYNSADFIKKRMIWKNEIYNASMVVFKKSCYYKITPDYKNFKYCGDWLFWSQICSFGDILEIPRKLNFFRQHTDKVSPQAEKEGLYFTEGSAVIMQNICILNLNKYQKWVIKGRFAKRMNTLKTISSDQKKELLNKNHLLNCNALGILLFYIIVYTFDKLFNFSHLQR